MLREESRRARSREHDSSTMSKYYEMFDKMRGGAKKRVVMEDRQRRESGDTAATPGQQGACRLLQS
jgi:hypothetical protein